MLKTKNKWEHSLHKFSIKDFFSRCDQICNFLQIWSHLLKKCLTENFIFCAVTDADRNFGDSF